MLLINRKIFLLNCLQGYPATVWRRLTHHFLWALSLNLYFLLSQLCNFILFISYKLFKFLSLIFKIFVPIFQEIILILILKTSFLLGWKLRLPILYLLHQFLLIKYFWMGHLIPISEAICLLNAFLVLLI